MASLPLSIPALYRKPQRSLTRPTLSHGFTVSCSSNGGRGVDRRDLLVGMGSLYGATNLVTPDALATPITTMEKLCGLACSDDSRKEPLNCCPPTPKLSDDAVVDYKLPNFEGKELRVRRPAHRVSKKYIEDYERAVTVMKNLPDDDPLNFLNQANVHCAYCNGAYAQKPFSNPEDCHPQNPSDPGNKIEIQIHNSWLFFPWHRWYLYFYERILGSLIGDPTFALPFWMPPMYTKEGSALNDAKRNENHLPQRVYLLYSGHDDSPDRIVQDNLTEMHTEMRNTELRAFYGEPYMLKSKPDLGPGAVERGSHNSVHRWCGDPDYNGQDMGLFYSAARDPIFFAHHANIDRLWTVWGGIQRDKGKETDFTDSDWLDTSFLFYDENRKLVRVKVRDALDAEKMGYTIESMDLPWLRYRPDARTKKSRIAYTSEAPKATDAGVFPVKLDKVVKVLVDRPKLKRSNEEKMKQGEQLVIEGIDVDPGNFVRFEVFINDEDDLSSDGGSIKTAEYAGAYSQLPHGPHRNGGNMNSQITRLGLTELLEDLDAEGDDKILVSLVPRAGGKYITIGGLKIVYV